MHVRVGFMLGLALTAAGCGADGPHAGCGADAPPGPRSAHLHDIWEAVFSHELKRHLKHVPEVEVFFLEIEGRDPPAEFLARFADLPRPARPASVASGPQKKSRPRAGMIDKETGKQGRILRIDSLEWARDDEVQVEGGYYENCLSATGMTYTVEWEDGRWVVTHEQLNWIA